MDFKSHEEVILPPDKTAKKRDQEKARSKLPGSRATEIHIPAGKEKVSRAAASMGAEPDGSAAPRVAVREVQIPADESRVSGAAASFASAEQNESADIEPRVLNGGLQLLNEASRQGSPGGRLIRSGQLSLTGGDEVEASSPRTSAEVRTAPKVKVEPVSEIRFPKDSVAEVATLQAPPPVELPPGQVAQITSNEFDEPPAMTEPEPPASEPGPAPLEIDSREFAQELDLPEPDQPLEIDSEEFAKELNLPEPEPPQVDSACREPAEPVRAPKPGSTEQGISSEPKVVQSNANAPEPRVVQKFGSKVVRKVKSPEPKIVQKIGSRVVRKVKPPPEPEVAHTSEPSSVARDPLEVADERHPPEPEPEIAPDSPEPASVPAVPSVPRDSSEEDFERDLPDPEPVVVVELGQAELVWEPPEVDDPEKPAKKNRGTARRKNLNQKPYRDFIIAYDGVFIGHFRSRKRITNRTAFQQVARQMHSTTPSFDVNKLQLFRPVPIEVEIPESLAEISDGSFMWFGDQQPRSSAPA